MSNFSRRILSFFIVFLSFFFAITFKTSVFAELGTGSIAPSLSGGSGNIYNGGYWNYYKIKNAKSSYTFPGYSGTVAGTGNGFTIGNTCNGYDGIYVLQVAGSSGGPRHSNGIWYSWGARQVGETWAGNQTTAQTGGCTELVANKGLVVRGSASSSGTCTGRRRPIGTPAGLDWQFGKSGQGFDTMKALYTQFYNDTPNKTGLMAPDTAFSMASPLTWFCGEVLPNVEDPPDPPPPDRVAKFSGSITITGSNGLSCTKSGNDYNCVGNGTQETFNMVRQFKVWRTDGLSIPGAGAKIAVGSDTVAVSQATSGGLTPTLIAGTYTASNPYTITGSSAVDKGNGVKLAQGAGGSLTIPYGKSAKFCFKLVYSGTATYASPYAAANRKSGTWASDINVCANVSNPAPKTATFGGSIEIAGSNGLTCSKITNSNDYNCVGNGFKTSFNMTRTFKVWRTDSDTSLNSVAGSSIAIGSDSVGLSRSSITTTAAGGTCPSSSYKTNSGTARCIIATNKQFSVQGSSAVDKGGGLKLDSGTAGNITIPYGKTGKFCFTMIYSNSSVYSSPYGAGNRVGGSWPNPSNNNYDIIVCANVSNPEKIPVTFSGAVSINADSRLFTTDNQNYVGDGVNTSYKADRIYKVTRTDSRREVASAVSTFTPCIYSDFSRCAGEVTNTKDLGVGQYDTKTYTKASYSIPLDTTKLSTCLNLKYQNKVYYDPPSYTTKLSTNATETTTSKCFYFTNPKEVSSYSYTSSASLNEHDRLVRSNSDKDGRINNTERNDKNVPVYKYPTSSDYYATFTHTVKRTANTTYKDYGGSDTTYASYKVQEQWNDGNWTDISGASGNKTFTVNNSAQTVYTNTSLKIDTMNQNNRGKYTKYCQRLVYSSTSSSPRGSNRNVNNTVFSSSTGTAVCVTLKNPDYKEYETPDWNTTGDQTNQTMQTRRKHLIDIVPNDPAINQITGAVKVGNTYQIKDYNVTAVFDHSFAREDRRNLTSSASAYSFDESLSGNNYDVTGVGTWTGGKILFSTQNGSMYNNRNSNVTTEYLSEEFTKLSSASRYSGPINRYPYPNSSTRYGMTFSASAWNVHDPTSWNTVNHLPAKGKNTTGRTNTSFGYSSSNNIVAAGLTYTLKRNTNVNPYGWYTKYADVMRREVYYTRNSNGTLSTTINDNISGSYMYDRTILKDAKATQRTTADGKSGETVTTFERKYNYKITNITSSTTSDNVVNSLQSIDPQFTISVTRDDGHTDLTGDNARTYITDMNSTATLYIYTVSESSTAGTSLDGLVNSGVGDMNALLNQYKNNGTVTGSRSQPITVSRTSRGVYTASEYTVQVRPDAIAVDNLPVGTKFCVALDMTNRSSTSTEHFHSNSYCVNVGKNPNAHILGSGVGASGNISTSLTTVPISGKVNRFGSWTDLTAIANGKISNFSSGRGIAKKRETNDRIPCGVSSLTIANDNCEGSANRPGGASIELTSSMLSKLVARFANGDSATAIISDGAMEVNAETFSSRGINAGSVGFNGVILETRPVFIYSKSSITVKTDIKNFLYNEGVLVSGNSVPQVIIAAEGDIKVEEGVSRLDAWLIAGGNVDTCIRSSGGTYEIGRSNNDENLSASYCEQQLTITGPVVGKNISLKRTYGADSYDNTLEAGAEIVDLNGSAFLFGANASMNNAQPKTTYVKTLAPRY